MTHLLGRLIAGVRIVDYCSLREASRRLYPAPRMYWSDNDARQEWRTRLRLRRKWLRARLMAPADPKPLYGAQ